MISDNLSIRKRVFEILRKNPYYKPKYICKLLGLRYEEHGHYVSTLKSYFHSYYKIGSPQKPHRRVFVWENVPRKLLLDFIEEKTGDRTFYQGLGWRLPKSTQRNRFLIYRGSHGTVHWYPSGKVILYLRGSLMLARVKELFSKAFSFLPGDMLLRYLDAPIREESRHMVFDVGGPMPRFEIRHYEKSHGLVIFTDGSHPQSLEVAETNPFWLQEFTEVVSSFGRQIDSHMQLISEWKKEAKERRSRRSLWDRIKQMFTPKKHKGDSS